MNTKGYINISGILILLMLGIFLVSCRQSEKANSLEEVNKEELLSEQESSGEVILDVEQETKILKGELTIGHEVRAFTPCWGDIDYWVIDKTGTMLKLYEALTEGKAKYTPIFVEIEIVDKGKSDDGFAADYEGVYEIVRILESKNLTEKDCE